MRVQSTLLICILELAWFICPISVKGQTFFMDFAVMTSDLKSLGKKFDLGPLTLMGQINQAQNVNLKMANLS